MEKRSTSKTMAMASLFFLLAQTSISQTRNDATIKNFVAAAPDTVEQGVPFVVDYTLTARGWDAGGTPLQGKGCFLQKVSYKTVHGTPYSQLQAKATYITSRSGNIVLPGMQVSVQKKKVFSSPKTIYVRPNKRYSEEMSLAHKWLVGHGVNDDSLCLTPEGMFFPKELWVFRDMRQHGFCIVAKKENWDVVEQPILAYSAEASAPILSNDLFPILDSYSKQITTLKKQPNAKASNNENFYGQKGKKVKPMLGDLQWGQASPYNHNVAFTINKKKGVIGCVPLAAGMIMNYHKWPKRAQIHAYYQTEQKLYKIDKDNFVPEWDSYNNAYLPEDTILCDNLSILLSTLGITIEASYNEKTTSASMMNVKSALCNNFGYSGKIRPNDNSLSDEKLIQIMYNELDQSRPFMVSINSHAFVCDGYDGDFMHFNLGWNGVANGYYRLKIGNYEAEKSLLFIKEFLYGIQPQHEDVARKVILNSAGTLNQQLSDEEKGNVTNLKVIGPLNSADIKLLRKMAGVTDGDTLKSSWTGGALRELDLSEAWIVGDKEPYLTESARGIWYHSETSIYGNNSSFYDFDTMDEKTWKKFKSEIGTKQEGMFYTRTDDNKYWANYYCTKNVIGKQMFSGATSLSQIILPEKTQKIDDYAFLNCRSLKTMHIPEKVKETGEKPFFRCPSLECVEAPRKMIVTKVLCEECSPALKNVTRY